MTAISRASSQTPFSCALHLHSLNRPKLTPPQAALRSHNRGKGIWILNGLAIRIAQSLGLHRDGNRLGLSPFQAEIRRRLWWHLLSRDSRAGEDYGLENTNAPLLMSDVNLPANVNDTDLTPEMSHAPEPRTGWTTMTFSLISIHLARTIQKLADMAASSSPSSSPSEDARAAILQELRQRVDGWLVHCNPVIPQQRLTIHCSRFILRKTDFVTRLQWILLQQRAGIHSDFATEENMTEALAILETNFHGEDGVLKRFQWMKKAYPQYNIAVYVLLHLCVKPEGPQVEQAWQAIDRFFADEESAASLGPKMLVLVSLRTKAMAVREKIQNRRPDNSRDGGCDSGAASSEVAGAGNRPQGTAVDEFVLDTNMDDWPDWATLVQDIQLDTSEIFLQ